MVQYFNGRLKKLSILDLKLIQVAAMLFALIAVNLVSLLVTVNIWWLFGILFLALIRPTYAFCIKTEADSTISTHPATYLF
ncbi:MAG: hypothetical protein OEV49_09580 [candidate division Zixibacteria bacterium]|nr:hypothetical protein [candidate division Zixibacteria bacterium]MDH3938157.1 hypothetical protein [candidate division Zixibacteria bacterium]